MESRGLIHRAERLAGPGQVAGQRGHRSIGIGHIQISGNECRQIVGAVFFQPGDDQFRRIAPRGRRLVIEMRIQIENFFAGIPLAELHPGGNPPVSRIPSDRHLVGRLAEPEIPAGDQYETIFPVENGHVFAALRTSVPVDPDPRIVAQPLVERIQHVDPRLLQAEHIGILFPQHFHDAFPPLVPGAGVGRLNIKRHNFQRTRPVVVPALKHWHARRFSGNVGIPDNGFAFRRTGLSPVRIGRHVELHFGLFHIGLARRNLRTPFRLSAGKVDNV